VVGVVTDGAGNALRSVSIMKVGSTLGTLSGESGTFVLREVSPGDVVLRATTQGYRVSEVSVRVQAGATAEVSFVLLPDPIGLDAVTITGTMRRTSVSASPVKVEIVPATVLQRSLTNNLTEALQYVNGLYNQVDCGVCYTNNIRINGMEGPYTAVLIDGMPILSSLASVYGLNGINPALVERVEILKGPASTLYGSEAMGGVINIITKDPRFAPRLAIDASTSSDLEGNLDFGVASEPGDLSAVLSGNLAYNSRFVDRIGDGFSDFPMNRRGVLFGKVDFAPEGRPRAALTTRYLYEDRFGGVEEWTRRDRGSSEVYGESIHTHRLELLGSYLFPVRSGLRFEGSYTWHDQDSWYGDEYYAATQHIVFGNLLWSRAAGAHQFIVGATARWQAYNDNTPATAEGADRRFIPGLFAQDELQVGPSLTLLGGARLDHHRAHGAIASPRLAVKWNPARRTALRLNTGTGFRVVNLFAEDHAALTGAREVVIAEALEPERSRSVSLNVNQIVEFGPNPMMIDVDLFHTRFSNQILPDYDVDPRLIVYENLRGHAVSRGVAVTVNQNVDFDRFLWTAGITLQDVYTVQEGIQEDAFFAPEARVILGATYQPRSLPLRLDYTGTVTGPMRLPEYDPPFERPTRSPTFSLHNLQGSWSVTEGTQIYAGVKNLFNYVQPTPLVAPEDPFGEDFDTAYVYGPMRGRHFLLGVRYGVPKR
jgi:outer membrane receptor for ferrienterochelin and colicins